MTDYTVFGSNNRGWRNEIKHLTAFVSSGAMSRVHEIFECTNFIVKRRHTHNGL